MKGKDVSSNALNAYDDLSKQADIDKTQQDFVKVVTSPNPGGSRLPDTPARPFSKQLKPRIAAYRALLDAYSKYQSLTDKDFGKQTSDAAGALVTSVKSLQGVPDLPSAVQTLLPAVVGLITSAQQSRDIRKYNHALTELSRTYESLWDEELPLWKEYLNRIYEDYADGFRSLDADRFDPKQLSEVVKEPFTEKFKIGLYKIQMRNEAFSRRDALIAKLDAVSQSFRQLNSAQTELVKAKPNVADALAELGQINSTITGVK